MNESCITTSRPHACWWPRPSSAIPSHLINSPPFRPFSIRIPSPSSHLPIVVLVRVSSSFPILLLSSHHPPPTIRHPSRSYAHTYRPSPTPDTPSSSSSSSSSSPNPSHFRSFTNLARYATISAVSAPVARISEGRSANPYCTKRECQFGFRVERRRLHESRGEENRVLRKRS
jgi:hypothetical protein